MRKSNTKNTKTEVINPILDETNTAPDLKMLKAQEDARLTVIDASELGQWLGMNVDTNDAGAHKGANTNETKKLDPKENPAQGFRKQPNVLASPNNADLKINV
jgi:hypothetical protein